MKRRAVEWCFDDWGSASAQVHNQWAPVSGRSAGAGAIPRREATLDFLGLNRVPAATVASTHIAHRPWLNRVRFSL